MENTLRRNRMMFRLSIIALVLYVVLILISMMSPGIFSEFEDIVSFRSIVNYICLFVLLIGYVAVYVLWTPDNDGNEKKRPTWQFVILIVAILAPIVQSVLYNIANVKWGTAMVKVASYSTQNSSGSTSRLFSIIDLFEPIRWAMIIILLIKCERKAKKILIAYIVSSFLYVVYFITDILMYKMELRSEYILINIYSILALVIVLLMLIFTIIYTRQKYNRLKPLEIDRNY